MSEENDEFMQDLKRLERDELGDGFNPELLSLVIKGRKKGYTDENISELIEEHAPARVGDRAPGEISRALERAYRPGGNFNRSDSSEANYTATIMVDPVDLPAPVNDPIVTFLETCFRPADYVRVCPGVMDDSGKSLPDTSKETVKTRDEWISIFKEKGGPSGVWPQTKKINAGCFVGVNPAKGGKLEDVLDHRHILVEMDSGSLSEQMGVLRASGIPCVSITYSGGKSLHALVRTNAKSAKGLKAVAQDLYNTLLAFTADGTPIGLDTSNCASNRLTRIPGSWRGDTMQTLLEVDAGAKPVESWLQDARDRILLLSLPAVVNGDSLACTEPPPQQPILDGLFDRGDKVVIIGSSKSRKTFFALQLALQLAAKKEAA